MIETQIIFINILIGAVFAAICAVALVRGITWLANAQKASQQGLTPSSYIFLTLLAWIAENNLFTHLEHESRAVKGAIWSILTLWWPPELLSHFPSVSFLPRPYLLVGVVAVAFGTAIALSILRLRNAALPAWIALLALIPFVNLGLLVFLSVAPTRSDIRPRNWVDYLLPRDELGSAVVACLAAALLGLGLTQFGTVFVGTYGSVVFTLVPVTMGFVGALIYGATEPRNWVSCLSVAVASIVVGGLTLMGFAIEGAVCVLMAAPLALPLAAFGGWLGYLVQRRPAIGSQSPQIAGALLLFLPFMMIGEQQSRTSAREIAVSTSIVIHAPAARVWQGVTHLSSVPKPDSIIFHSVAYPIRTTLEGSGPGARRQCVFSTGSIVEPISVWNPARELRFSVVSQPPLMRELSPYSDVHPPHLKLKYLRSKEGQFTLTPQPDGSTLLTGTSYYESRLWPGAYWQLWTDAIAHKVHRVVLEEIRREAEQTR